MATLTTRFRTVAATAAVAFLVSLGPLATSAHAQISGAVGPSNAVMHGTLFGGGGVVRGSASAFDPVNNVRLVVAAQGGVVGTVVNVNGLPIGAPIAIWSVGSGFAQFPTVTYSPHLAGGAGAFLVTWHASSLAPPYPNIVYALVVSATQGPIGNVIQIADEYSFPEVGAAPAVAYSPASRAFVIAWQTYFPSPAYRVRARMLPVDSLIPGPGFDISVGSAQYPSAAYNPSTGHFGVGYTGFGASGATVTFALLTGNGVVIARNLFHIAAGTFITDLAVNPSTGRYVMTWSDGPGTSVAEFAADGTLLGKGIVATTVGGYDSGSLSYSPASGTFLVVGHGQTAEVSAAELNSRGSRISAVIGATSSATVSAGTFYPRASAGPASVAQWTTTFSRDTAAIQSHIVSTVSTQGGGAVALPAPGTPPPSNPPPGDPPPAGGCTSVSPGAGWTCVNGGWQPPSGGGTGGTGGCTSVSPGTGWTCVNGGWQPPSAGGTGSTGCASVSPGTGWTCVNGGWQPPSGGGTGGSTGGCPGTAPFAGAVCVNGGWVPGSTGGGGSTGGCPGTAPFAGAVCVNGGWVPGSTGGGGSTGGCPGTAPFAGAVCVNGGWVPGSTGGGGTTGCPGTAPFAGAVCVNGGWVPGTSGGGTTGCPGTAPFAGAVCVNGGWVPGSANPPAPPPPPPPPASTAKTDFNGDGLNDIVFQNAQGQIYAYFMSGPNLVSGSFLVSATLADPTWQIVGTSDFTGDGKPDLLWQHEPTGIVVLYIMNGATKIGEQQLEVGGTRWRVGGTGDVNHDGYPDIVWRHLDTGQVYAWFRRPVGGQSTALPGAGGNHIVDAAGGVYTEGVSEWRIVGIADFNNDGHNDIAWQHLTTRDMRLWYLNGVVRIATSNLGASSVGWRVAGIANFAGDALPDVLFHHDTGGLSLWIMSGTSLVPSTITPASVHVAWRVVGPR